MDPITPIFERYQRKFTYECNDGILSNNEKEVILSIENLSAKTLPVPTRDGYSFEGWYSDWHHTVQVADKTGKVIVGKDWLDNDNFYDGKLKQVLYAKWKPIKEVPTYKVLLVFVTEAHALLESTLHGMIQVDYVMNEDERKICESIVVYVRDYLNALLNGTVNFEVDSYFTKEPIGTKNFNCGSVGYKGMVVNDYGIYAERNLPEVEGMLDDYGSVLTTFCMNDYKSKLHRGAGAAGKNMDT